MLTEKEQKEWYNNQRIYEMMVELSKKLESTDARLDRTEVLIRDYNGLRETINDCALRLAVIEGQKTGSKDMWGYVVGGIGLLFAILAWVVK